MEHKVSLGMFPKTFGGRQDGKYSLGAFTMLPKACQALGGGKSIKAALDPSIF